MGEFYKIAESILYRIEDREERILNGDGDIYQRRTVSIDEVRDEATYAAGKEINFYPGEPGAPCHELAVFVSLSSPLYVKGRKHLKCNEAMEKIVQHMLGRECVGQTRQAVFITDSWDVKAFAKWQGNLEQVSKSSHFEVYLITGRSMSQIKI